MRFETINGTLCIMTEPKPLVTSIEYPYVISGIKTKHTLIVTKDMDALLQIFIRAYSEEFEVIGYPVAEGSAEWALWAMMEENKVINSNSTVPFTLTDDRIVRIDDSVSWDVGHWLRIFDDTTGWQLYKEPEPEQQNPMPTTEFVDLSDAPAGWICKTRDGGNYPLKYIEVSPTRYAYEDKSGLTVYVMANGRYKKNGTDGRDIIACEPEQPKYKVGDWVRGKSGHAYEITAYPSKFLPDNPNVYDAISCMDGQSLCLELSDVASKLKPSEVIVHIGCLSGTVRPVSTNGIHIWFHLIGVDDKIIATIRISSLDTSTRELVESLLEAQEEDE